MDILSCENSDELELLATNFTATSTHFGLVETVELGVGGEGRRVTMDNREEFVQKLFNWLLTGEEGWRVGSLQSGHPKWAIQTQSCFGHMEIQVLQLFPTGLENQNDAFWTSLEDGK